ncbi:efflux transporter outer membrane subunit [Ramlibacter sp.]|uniref:efflux transporter outer membrane subunit n=1 Tax=Ramlibacter sp. TaxID=1917967 RepID=UPI0017E45CCA|nr:efflux transporter outer membrane subunit [Ramlibacter sp.]MBA2673122.1 efflux transporter outer membrane subunit [Ramlibacter sp.]
MNTLRLLALLGIAMGLSGCAVPHPPENVNAATPPQWYAPLPHNGTMTDLTRWWQQFNDPLLIELIGSAQTASPTVATAASNIEQARAARVAARAALLPTLDATAAASRSKSAPPTPIASVVQTGLDTAWEIDVFGGNRGTARAAQARLESAQAGWHEARVSVAAETANSYLNLRTCERQLVVATNDARSRAETARLSDLSVKAGFTAPANAALARASAAESSARATQQRAQCEIEVKALVALTGLAEPQLRQKLLARWAEPAQFALVSVAALPAQVVAQRPDVYRAEREVAAASAEVGTARADRFPRVSLSGSIGLGRVHAQGVSASLDTWSIGPLAVTVPLFDGGRRAANVDATQARYEEAVLLYGARVRQAVREVEEALVTLDSARARSTDAQTAVDGYRVSFNATEARYRSGLASLIELEDQRRLLLAAETNLVALQRERISAWIALYRAVGGGWARPDAATVAGS